MPYYKKLTGKLCYLSPRDPDDCKKSAGWLNDVETSMNMSIRIAPNEVNIGEQLTGGLKAGDHGFAIVDLATDTHIGDCGLHEIDWVNRTASFGIMIGEKEFWGKGYGAEATRLILDYGFNILNLESIRLQVKEFNKRGVRAYEKAGFKMLGIQRKETFFGRKGWDVANMDALAEEFESPYIKGVMDKILNGVV
ncbi:MAG: GNAT family N-acetyltransferase [Brevinematales bacterium]|nr:GNAT family N-acetyltransferase [Brevinematales bacterium]